LSTLPPHGASPARFNEKAVLQDREVEQEFVRRRYLLLRADWTRCDPEITNELSHVGRSGVPTYVILSGVGQAAIHIRRSCSRAAWSSMPSDKPSLMRKAGSQPQFLQESLVAKHDPKNSNHGRRSYERVVKRVSQCNQRLRVGCP
jgi:hypothetical protein